ncbi:hypothetical protein AX774_g7111 [Zancudomyces culisetae]|uniref:Uncharacterized protein n=1 Tax=Zancudomyces culisetae TaxID=1213189 RepID=A0A1R1PF35_ZANCU|nr:hypothetical protein AX774_g7111 [Zancudomyces culisetae]|eukprot:OMH79482.1 hypothetical protein AX774_g7111 [Zancudomyces culisetae]
MLLLSTKLPTPSTAPFYLSLQLSDSDSSAPVPISPFPLPAPQNTLHCPSRTLYTCCSHFVLNLQVHSVYFATLLEFARYSPPFSE